MNNINIKKQNDYREELMWQTDEEEREEAERSYRRYRENRARHSGEALVSGIKGAFVFGLSCILLDIFKPLDNIFVGVHEIFYLAFLLLLLYVVYLFVTKISFRWSLVLFVISLVYVLNNGGMSVFIK